MKLVAAKSILKANDQLAAENRRRFDSAGVFCVNIVGSPGCGKTTLLEALFDCLRGDCPDLCAAPAQRGGKNGTVPFALRPAVIEGDIAGSIDADRMEALGVPVVQINTEGACHLDANMTASAVGQLDLADVDLLLIENVGNLVCTAGFDLGEHLRIIVLSTTEGDDKAVKYPAVFQGSDALVVSKMDMLPHTNFSVPRITADMKRLAPEAAIFQVAALKREGTRQLAEWIANRRVGQSPDRAALPV